MVSSIQINTFTSKSHAFQCCCFLLGLRSGNSSKNGNADHNVNDAVDTDEDMGMNQLWKKSI